MICQFSLLLGLFHSAVSQAEPTCMAKNKSINQMFKQCYNKNKYYISSEVMPSSTSASKALFPIHDRRHLVVCSGFRSRCFNSLLVIFKNVGI